MKKIALFIMAALILTAIGASAETRETTTQAETTIQETKETVIDRTAQIKERIQTARDTSAKELSRVDFKTHYQSALRQALENCEKADDPALCRERMQERIESITQAGEATIERLKTVEARKIVKSDQMRTLMSDEAWKKFDPGNGKAREIAQTRIEQARQAYQQAIMRYTAARERYENAQGDFAREKARLQDCLEEECPEIESRVQEQAKQFLLSTSERILEHIKKAKAAAEQNEELTEEEADEIITDLDRMEQEIVSLIETIENAETKEEITEAAQALRSVWSSMQPSLEGHTGKMVNSRIGGVIVQIKQLEIRLERTIARMEEQGIDTEDIQDKIDLFNEKLMIAQEEYDSAYQAFTQSKEIADIREAREKAREGHDYMMKSHRALQEAQKLLRGILQDIKEAGGTEAILAPEDTAESTAETTEDAEE